MNLHYVSGWADGSLLRMERALMYVGKEKSIFCDFKCRSFLLRNPGFLVVAGHDILFK